MCILIKNDEVDFSYRFSLFYIAFFFHFVVVIFFFFGGFFVIGFLAGVYVFGGCL